MKQSPPPFLIVLALFTLSASLSCSPRSAPVTNGVLVGKWQRVDKPAVTLEFREDGSYRASVEKQSLLSGHYQLLQGQLLVLHLDAAATPAPALTNRIEMVGTELRITPSRGAREDYRRTP